MLFFTAIISKKSENLYYFTKDMRETRYRKLSNFQTKAIGAGIVDQL